MQAGKINTRKGNVSGREEEEEDTERKERQGNSRNPLLVLHSVIQSFSFSCPALCFIKPGDGD